MNDGLPVDGNCEHCNKDLSKQDQVFVASRKVFCNKKCCNEVNYAVTGPDGYTRISSRKEDLPRYEYREIVEVEMP